MRQRRWAVMLILLGWLSGIPSVASPSGAASVVTAQAVATGLQYPAMFTVAPDNRIFYSERTTGRIGVVDPADGRIRTYFQVPDVCGSSDQGLYGLALHPTFPSVPALYAYATRRAADGTCDNQVVRIEPAASGQLAMTVLLTDRYVGGHNGGRLLFGPDGNLYASTGDGANGLPTLEQSKVQRAAAQDPTSLKGKVLRMTPTGGVPETNPSGGYAFAYGFRNVFGFDFDPVGGALWAADNGPDPEYPGDPRGPGPSGGCNDELNLVLTGSNYGWGPTGSCGKPPEAPLNTNQDGPDPVLPELNIEAASGITAATFCSGCRLGSENEGRLLWGRYSYLSGSSEIRAATLSADRSSVGSDVAVHRPPGAAPLSIERGPDGTIYYSDSSAIYRLVDSGTTSTTVAPPSTTTVAPPTTTTTTAPSGPGTALVTSFTPTSLRSDYSGWAGTRLVVGSSPLQVTALGRWVVAGNSRSHRVKLVDAATGADVAGASATVDTAGAPVGFRYATLAGPVTLQANTAYFLVSEETAGGDVWYDYDTRLATTAAASVSGVVYLSAAGDWVTGGGPGMGYVPPNLLYTTGSP